MHRLIPLTLLFPCAVLCAQTVPPAERQVAAAVLALPEPMRASATVLGYRELGKLVELRRGSNGMTCLADYPADSTFHVACYHDSLEPFMARGRALRAEGVTGGQVDSVRFREIREGKLAMPSIPAALRSLTAGAGAWNADSNTVRDGRPLYVVYIPFATTESTGIMSTPAPNQPWLMYPGTPKAHIMFVPRM